jgi:Fur family transcriptional regulator, ferric uptake regulator
MKNTAVTSVLKQSGLRDTQPRRMVIAALARAKALSPSAIELSIRRKGATINTVTVYRVLSALESLDLVHRHPCNGEYSLCSMPGKRGHHGFLHCTSCGIVEEFLNHDLCVIENKIARSRKFRPTSHVSEIVGTCRSCS